MRARRGFAMMAAIWLTVAIAVVALEFARDAKERRLLGIDAAERGAARAAALGVLAQTQERLERAIRQVAQSGNTNTMLRGSDPWLDVDSLYSGSVGSDSAVQVNLRARDLGAQLNVNLLSEDELKTFFGYALNDYAIADQLAQSVMDWRDPDDIARVKGGERDDYIKAGLLRLPTNQNFRDVEELLDVKGMTPEVYRLVSPYLTTMGSAQVNLNTAPVPVLRVLPGMTDEIVARILALRSRGSRIASVAEVMPQQRGGMSRDVQNAMAAQNARSEQQLSARAGVLTTQLQVTLLARASHAAKPVRLRVLMQRSNVNGTPAAGVTAEEWR